MTEKQAIRTEDAPAPYQGAPYSQAIRAGELVFVSGQLGVIPATAAMAGETIEEQTEQVIANLAGILGASGSSLDRVVKTTCFLSDLSNFGAFNEVYRKHFGEAFPARSTFGVSLPAGVLVEVEAVATVG